MSDYDFDLFVIGAGSGGVRAARVSADLGARVAVAESRYLGGTCVNVGCVPKKLLTYAAHYRELWEAAPAYGWTIAQPSFSWHTLRENKNREITRLNGVYQRLLEGTGCRIVRGTAHLIDPHTVALEDGERFTAANILVATGCWPKLPQDIPGIELAVSSNEAFHFETLPERLLIIGGGYIANEFSCIFNGLGCRVVQSHRGEALLRGFDDDVRQHLSQEMPKKGIDLRLQTTVTALRRAEDGIGIVAELSDGTRTTVDAALCCIGRAPLTEGLGLQAVGVELTSDGAVMVDNEFRTNVPHIFAVGDVIDRVQLTPVALAEGMAVANHLFGPRPRPVTYDNVPTAVFSNPPVGTVGLNEHTARQRHGDDIEIYRSTFRPMFHSLPGTDTKMLMKLIVRRSDQRVLGCHIVGPDAAEIVQGFAVALNCGATKAQLDRTVGLHPTAAEELVTMREPVTSA